jgi:hypothetical protein
MLFFSLLTNFAIAETPEFSNSQLVNFVQQARDYFEKGKGCPPEFDFDDRQ